MEYILDHIGYIAVPFVIGGLLYITKELLMNRQEAVSSSAVNEAKKALSVVKKQVKSYTTQNNTLIKESNEAMIANMNKCFDRIEQGLTSSMSSNGIVQDAQTTIKSIQEHTNELVNANNEMLENLKVDTTSNVAINTAIDNFKKQNIKGLSFINDTVSSRRNASK